MGFVVCGYCCGEMMGGLGLVWFGCLSGYGDDGDDGDGEDDDDNDDSTTKY